ncbi:NUDIX hydrolase [Salimicrobium flavidum]|uniref:Isopentenyldiphosphate isomerase n=1 Tax=Salimicrobium flavidum TaxID=570947 RepID=A0A1N7JJA5_9BACI|nr:NUDIX domain-containing protein [Salimicrobium flavidum]SIS49380.1 Isopentenyldiphosphate isomerase [Salimicrobium flavidum]
MEFVNIFTETYEYIGVMEREEAHTRGEWHEVFHCWCLSCDEGEWHVYLQLRSPDKKDYPGLYDITAAGHLEADESVEDGVREVKEEIGIDVAYEELEKVALLDTWIGKDREFAHEHMYVCRHSFSQFTLQEEEVEDVDRVSWEDFKRLWLGTAVRINSAKGHTLQRESFVPHENEYYPKLIEAIDRALIGRT